MVSGHEIARNVNRIAAGLTICFVAVIGSQAAAKEGGPSLSEGKVDAYSDKAPDTNKALAFNHRQLLRIAKSSRRAAVWTPDSKRKTDGPICAEILDGLRAGTTQMPKPVAVLDEDSQIDSYYGFISEIAVKYGKYAEARLAREYADKPVELEAALKEHRWHLESEFLSRDSYKQYSILSFLLSRPRASDDAQGNSPVPFVTRRLYTNGVGENGEARYIQAAFFGDRRSPDRRFIGIASWGLSPDESSSFSGAIEASDTTESPFRYFGALSVNDRTFVWGIQPTPRSFAIPERLKGEAWTWLVDLESSLGAIRARNSYCIILFK